jgi:hypothetical protein
MSIEKTAIAQARSYVVKARAEEKLQLEAFKGANPILSTSPVGLEPIYLPPEEWHIINTVQDWSTQVAPCKPFELIRISCKINPKHSLEWIRAERFIQELCRASYRVGFEIIGNHKSINIGFLVHQQDYELLKVAFEGEYPECQLTRNSYTVFDQNIYFYDYYSTAPYHHLQTLPFELQTTPYESFIRALAELPDNSQGFVQLLFQPAKNDWHRNIKILTDLEFMGKSDKDPYSVYRSVQVPSGELRNMAREMETKAHEHKHFYFLAARSGICTTEENPDIRALTAFMGLIQNDGKPLPYLTERDYQHFNISQIQNMLFQGLTYHHGFLLNTSELAALVHIPKIFEEDLPMERLETLTLPRNQNHLTTGIEIGTGWEHKGNEVPIFINDNIRKTGIHLIGKSGYGKTTAMEHMILQDINNNQGLAFIDPHGDSIKKLLKLIPQEKVDAIIYLNLGDLEWVPLWNPLHSIDQFNIGRSANNLVAAIKSVVEHHAWGDRLEHILRLFFYGLLELKDATFFDLLTLLEQPKKEGSEKREELKNRIQKKVTNPAARLFWQRDYDSYRRDDFAPPLHKLSKLLTSDETVALMLTQHENRIDFKTIMENNKVLLLDLSNLGSDTRGILGNFFLTFLYNTALSRNIIDQEQRRPFSIYVDEAHLVTTDSLSSMIAENRKFSINLTLAHQFMSQFKSPLQRDSLASIGNTIIFNVNQTDANNLVKNLQKKVENNDLISLKTGETIAKIGTDIVKIKTPKPKTIPEKSYEDEIIAKSHELYHRRVEEIDKFFKHKQKRLVGARDFAEGLSFKKTDIPDKKIFYNEF